MYSRMVNCTIDPQRTDDFRAALTSQLPRIQSQPGFIDSIESLDPATGKFCCMTLWQSATDVENYANDVFPDVAATLTPFLQDQPTVQTLPVEHSSAHNIRAGKAAA